MDYTDNGGDGSELRSLTGPCYYCCGNGVFYCPTFTARRLSSLLFAECSKRQQYHKMLLLALIFAPAILSALTRAGHFLNADGTPHNPYHELHLPHEPPLYPTLDKVPHTAFSCEGRDWGLHADTEAYCQAFHLCQDHLVRSFLCPNGTLFHQQFKVCDQFYNVRCGVPLEDQ
ncbi:uncharacterized protein LOC111870897 [Cryptotermes secundus]|uniref:uncharacterized protein LOC111870897 n=1 Tax=Cryptotermes secundus TaxID=105785 RepID=UPI000CD7C6DD|nr:uncharacterized protein LOC111870897 [Cryptotermes secundus]